MNYLIVGCGYLGQRVASRLIAERARVYAITRSEANAIQLAKQSIQPLVVDWYRKDNWPTLPPIDRVLISVSHAPVVDIPATETHALGLTNLFNRLASSPERIAYLSTTGVYAACDDGRWIDESSPVGPNRPGSIAALSAEKWLAENISKDRLAILRAAGIYGPSRIPRLEKLRAQEPIEVDPDSYLNLVHVDDLAKIAIELMKPSAAQGVFNVSDGQPVLRRDYYQYISKTIVSAPPVFSVPITNKQDSNLALPRSRGEGNKRIANRRIVKYLGYEFQFPDYIAGLSPLL